MYNVRITAVRKTEYADLSEKYENSMENACDIREGQVFISENAAMPKDFCESAWQSIYPFVLTLACGGENIYNSWMKNSKTAMISCNDGFRPVSFYLEIAE